MYKLTMIKGPRPVTFPLRKGTHLIGRNPECDIHIDSEFVSKKHATLMVADEIIILEDLNSRNGTFVNGVKVQKTSLKPGDRISFQNIVLELQTADEKKVSKIPPATMEKPPMTRQKVALQKVLSPYFEKIAERMEWKYLTLILVSLFIVTGFATVVPPLLNKAKTHIRAEALKRGELIVRQVAAENQKHLQLHQGSLVVDTLRLSIAPAKPETRLVSINIVDPRTKRILAPPERLNQSIDDRNPFLKGAESKTLTSYPMAAHQFLISQPIYLYSQAQEEQIVGAVVQAVFDTQDLGFSSMESTQIMLRSLLVLVLIGIIFYFLLHQLTLSALQKVDREIENAAQKGYRHLELQTKFSEIAQVIRSINKVFKRTRELALKLPEEEGGPILGKKIEDTEEILSSLLSSFPDGVAILNEGYQIIKANPTFQKYAGIHVDPSVTRNMLDVVEDSDFLRNLTHSLGQVSEGGTVSEDVVLHNESFQLSVTGSLNPNHEIEFYILNLKQVS